MRCFLGCQGYSLNGLPTVTFFFCVAGIDSSNIVEGGRRSRPQVNYHAVLKPKYLEAIESDSVSTPCCPPTMNAEW